MMHLDKNIHETNGKNVIVIESLMKITRTNQKNIIVLAHGICQELFPNLQR